MILDITQERQQDIHLTNNINDYMKKYYFIVFILELLYYLNFTLMKFVSCSNQFNLVISTIFALFLIIVLIKLWILYRKDKITLKEFTLIGIKYYLITFLLAIPFFFIVLFFTHIDYLIILVEILHVPTQMTWLLIIFLLSGYFTRNLM